MSVPVIYFDLGDTLVHGPSGAKVPFDDARATIEELWWRGYRIGLLSDQPVGTTVDEMRDKLTAYGLDHPFFDVITISSEFSPPIYKPDPQIFQAALAKAGHAVASHDTVFITENLQHIEAARALGWRAIHKPYQTTCTPASGECIADLDELLDLFEALPIDAYLRDNAQDPGNDQSTGAWWNSPDLWIRHQSDDGTVHQPPEFGQDNWFYARVHNRGTGIARMVHVGFRVQLWAGTEFVYPGDYVPNDTSVFAMNIDPGQFQVVRARWNAADVPVEGTHACWLAALHPLSQATSPIPIGAHVWEHNNLAQKNLTIVDLLPNEVGEIPIVIGSRQVPDARLVSLELQQAKPGLELPVQLIGATKVAMLKLVRAAENFARPATTFEPSIKLDLHFLEPTSLGLGGSAQEHQAITLALEAGSVLSLAGRPAKIRPEPAVVRRVPHARLLTPKDAPAAIAFAPVPISQIELALRPRQIVHAKLHVRVPESASPGDCIEFDLIQRDARGMMIGGIAVRVNVRGRKLTQKHIRHEARTERGDC